MNGTTAYEVDLLGSFVLRRSGVRQELRPTAERLVAVLALSPRRTRSRSVLAGLLRPDAGEDQALRSLRSDLWRLHRSQSGLVEAAGDSLRLQPHVSVDLDALQDVLDRPLVAADPRLDRPLPAGSELLAAWDEEWVSAERERVRQLWNHGREVLARALLRERRYGAALEAVLRVVAQDPLRESAHRLVIQVHLAEGNVVAAARQYEACRELLDTELGLAPSPLMLDVVRGAVPSQRGP
jgi:DNA-binding SARP family transcriptional activator